MKLISIISLSVAALTLSVSHASFATENQRRIDVDSTVVTEHKARINGDRFSYTATTGTQPVWDDKGDAVATLQYTYYERDKVDDRTKRPLLISFVDQVQRQYGCT